MDELQLAIALSASEAPDGLGEIELEQRGSKKRKRCTKPQQEPALTNLTSSQIQQKIMNRLECVFGDNVSCIAPWPHCSYSTLPSLQLQYTNLTAATVH